MDSAINSAPLPMLAFCSQVSPLKVSSGRPSNNELSNWSTSCLRKVWIFKTKRNLLSGSAWNWWSGNWNWLPLWANFPNPKLQTSLRKPRNALRFMASPLASCRRQQLCTWRKSRFFFGFGKQIWNSSNTYEFDIFSMIPESLPNWKQSRSESDACVMCGFTKKKLLPIAIRDLKH